MIKPLQHPRRFLSSPPAALLVLFLAGCASRGGTVNLNSADRKTVLSQSFAQAYITQGRGGEYDIILVDNATEWNYQSSRKNRPLDPVTLDPVRQMMHIHLYWRPLAGTTRNPAAVNASFNWYVLGPEGSTDVLAYEGAGYVAIRGSGAQRKIIIRDGQLKPRASRGNLYDPIGPASISGRATARVNETRAREILYEIQQEANLAQP